MLPDDVWEGLAAGARSPVVFLADREPEVYRCAFGRIMTDNVFAYRHSHAFHAAVAAHDATQKFIKPHCPWQNGKVERFNRTALGGLPPFGRW